MECDFQIFIKFSYIYLYKCFVCFWKHKIFPKWYTGTSTSTTAT